MAELLSSNLRVWEFDRYVRGQLKAEGIRISRATNEEQARRMAAEMAYPGDVLVMRSVPETGTELQEDRAYYSGARQAAAMAHQSLSAMDEWIAGGCGGRVRSVVKTT